MTLLSWLKLSCIVVLFGFVAACKSPVNIEPVTVEVLSCAPAETNTQVQLQLRISSANIYPIAIKSIDGKLYLNGEYVGRLSRKEPVGLPQLGIVTQKGRLFVEKPDVLASIVSSNAKVSYRLESRIGAEVIEEHSEIKSSQKGELDVSPLKAVFGK